MGDPVLQELSAIAVANARVRTGDVAGLADLRRVTAAAAAAEQKTVMIGYVLTIENLWQLRRYTDLDAVLDEASDHARQRELHLYRDYLAAYRARARVGQGAWEETAAQLRGLVDKLDDQQAALRYALPELARRSPTLKGLTDGFGADPVLECVGTDASSDTAFAVALAEGRLARAISVSSFYPDRLIDLTQHVETLPPSTRLRPTPSRSAPTGTTSCVIAAPDGVLGPFAEGQNDRAR